MTIAAGETIYREFMTKSGGELTDAAAMPVGTIVRNGVDTAVTVVVSHKATGIYVAQFTIPSTYSAGDEVSLRIAATIGGTATASVVWHETLATTGAAAAGVAGVDYATNLETVRLQITQRLVEITANPKPSYNVNGQQVGWTEYQKMLLDQLEKLNELIALGDGTPWCEEMQVFL